MLFGVYNVLYFTFTSSKMFRVKRNIRFWKWIKAGCRHIACRQRIIHSYHSFWTLRVLQMTSDINQYWSFWLGFWRVVSVILSYLCLLRLSCPTVWCFDPCALCLVPCALCPAPFSLFLVPWTFCLLPFVLFILYCPIKLVPSFLSLQSCPVLLSR